jgi:hypothetical protein
MVATIIAVILRLVCRRLGFQSKHWQLERECGYRHEFYGMNSRGASECVMSLTCILVLCFFFAQFQNAFVFNRNIGNWDVGSVTRMDFMVRIFIV